MAIFMYLFIVSPILVYNKMKDYTFVSFVASPYGLMGHSSVDIYFTRNVRNSVFSISCDDSIMYNSFDME